ncbi:hypothetical protein [Geodermatophilus sp. SYSU D00700]
MMIPEPDILDLLLALAGEFTSDGGRHWIVRVADHDRGNAVPFAVATSPFAAVCWRCRREVEDALRRSPPAAGRGLADTGAPAWWRLVRDGADGVAFLHEHAHGASTPAADATGADDRRRAAPPRRPPG